MVKMNPILWNSETPGRFSVPIPEAFVAGKKALRLKLRSERKTWLQFSALLTDDSTQNGYAARLLAEWEGDQDIDLRVSSLSRIGEPSGLEHATRLCFSPDSFAFSPTIIEVKGFEWLDAIPLYRVNDRDYMLENFMGPRYWDLQEWVRLPGDGLADGEIEFVKNWIWCVMAYAIKPGRAHRLAFEKEYNVDISGFEAMLVSVTTDNRGLFRCRLTVDGRKTLALEQRGISDRHDLRIPLNGGKLQKIAIEVAEAEPHRPEDEGQKIGVNLSWFLLQKKGYDPKANMEIRGCEKILPNENPEPFEKSLPFAFLLNQCDIAELKNKIASSAFHQKVYRGIINEAESHLRYPDPEPLVGKFSFVPYTRYGLNLMQDPTLPAHQVLVYSALAYALSGEKKYADTARRFLLSICRCDNWSTGFITRFPIGLEGYRHPLADGPMARSVAVCCDLIFNVLTESDKREVEDAMMRCAAPIMDSFLQRVERDPGFKRSNMFMCYSLCVLYAIKVAARTHPEAMDFHDRALRRLQDVMGLIYENDGSSHEGMAYWQFTTSLAVEAALLLSRELAKPVPDVMPEGFKKTIDFILNLHSTSEKGPFFFGFADGASVHDQADVAILFFYKMLGRKDALWLFDKLFLKDILENGDKLAPDPSDPRTAHFFGARNWMIINHGLLLLKFYDKDKPVVPGLPPYRRFDDCGRVFMRTGVETGDTVLFFEGGSQTFFHTHRDKGQILLDAKGVQFLTDAGMISYHDPGAMYYGRTAYHNVITIHDADQDYADPAAAVVLTKVETNFEYSFINADITASYKGIEGFRRSVLFVRPDYFVVLDEVDAACGGIGWNFHSTLPFELAAHGAWVNSDKAALLMSWPDKIFADMKTGAYYDSKGKITCHNLFLKPDESVQHIFMPVVLFPYGKADKGSVVRKKTGTGRDGYQFVVKGPFGKDVVMCRDHCDGNRSIAVSRAGGKDFTIVWKKNG